MKQKGFTLIELLIVIAILGVLAAGVVVAINPAKRLGQARDSRRKTDISQIRHALENYYVLHNNMYPRAGACAYGANCYVYSNGGSSWIPALVSEGELKTLPVDPLNSGGNGPWWDKNYVYSYGNVTADGQNFDLLAQLENLEDPDRCGLKNYRHAWGGIWCTAFGGVYTNQLYEMSPMNKN